MTTTLLTVSAVILFGYIAVTLSIFRTTLTSLSESYYLYEAKYGKGWLFQLFLSVPVLLLIPFWIEISEGSSFQFLGFLAPASILFVATAPKFKENFEGKVHEYSAYFGALCSLLWVILVSGKWYIVVICGVVFVIFGLIQKTLRKNLVFWLEMVSFVSTYLAIIAYIS